MLKMYAIEVIETLRKRIVVEAATEDAAYQQVVDRYYNGDIVLTADDYLETNFEVDKDFDPEMYGKEAVQFKEIEVDRC